MTTYVDVILPLALPRLYTYRVPDDVEALEQGQRVVVQFGKKKLYAALVYAFHDQKPHYPEKNILEVLDDSPIVTKKQIELWHWMASYYMCTLGEVMKTALPSALKLQSETRIVKLDADYSNLKLNDSEYLIMEALDFQSRLTIEEIMDIIGKKTVMPHIRSLLDRKLIALEEELIERYKPKVVSYIRLAKPSTDEVFLEQAFEKVKNAPKQRELLMVYLDEFAKTKQGIKPSTLAKRADTNSSTVKELINKGIFIQFDEDTNRIAKYDDKVTALSALNEEQENALQSLQEQYKEKRVALLHGVTGSGKTELYIELIAKTVKEGKQVLYLLPEIALTAQIIRRLQNKFGDRVGIYHSKFNNQERVEVWNRTLIEGKHQFDIIIGARSSLFLPFSNLGLVIVDEEHETSFKQQDPAPRYHARDTAIYLAGLHKANVLLGSATPSLESYYNAQMGKYAFAKLDKRFGDVKMPDIELVDIKLAHRKKQMKSHFSPRLLELLEEAIAKKEQAILFQNRRGFSPLMECQTCGFVPQCVNCDISLTYHKAIHKLRCHYCGYTEEPPNMCSACGNTDMHTKGFGTEQIEEELGLMYPDLRIKRMDFDTTRTKNAYYNIISDFEDGEIDVLVGTQMLTKGLDFDNVGLVGILNADHMLHFPDFRSFERSFQLMAQVSGRAGRKNKQGKVIIQTYNTEHPVIRQVQNNDYLGLYNQQLQERTEFKYPPFYRLIEITLKHKDYKFLNIAADEFSRLLRVQFGARVLGPEYPPVSRLRGYFRKNLLLKLEKEVSHTHIKEQLAHIQQHFSSQADFKSVRIIQNVDPS